MSHFCLRRDAHGYTLLPESGNFKGLHIDFTSARLAHRRTDGGRELLLRAVKPGPGARVFDATAGLGVDSFILASRGCEVTMVERSHTLWLMLEDALARAALDPATQDIVARMRLLEGDARYHLAHLDGRPDAILIDPMFPARRKHAAVRGELQMLQQLIGKDEDVSSLVAVALATGCPRVVVKRPLQGGRLAEITPGYSIKGKASRFDVFVQPG